MTNLILGLLFLIPSIKQKIETEKSILILTNENQIIIKNNLNNHILFTQFNNENIIRISRYDEYLILHLSNNSIYVYREGCNNLALFKSKTDFLTQHYNNDISYMFE